jgi:hypothetical protein
MEHSRRRWSSNRFETMANACSIVNCEEAVDSGDRATKIELPDRALHQRSPISGRILRS